MSQNKFRWTKASSRPGAICMIRCRMLCIGLSFEDAFNKTIGYFSVNPEYVPVEEKQSIRTEIERLSSSERKPA